MRNIRKYFASKAGFREILSPSKRQYTKAVDDVSFEVGRQKTFVIAGESGSGKTTVARLIMRAIDPDGGSILFDGNDVTKYTGQELKRFRTSVQMVHQDPYSSLNPRMKILDSMMEPLNIHDRDSSKEKKVEKVLKALDEVRLEPASEIAQRYPHMLSGGQRQRVALARALVLRPALIVADEPVSMLDVSVRAEILELMNSLKEKFGISFIYITHDLSTARYIGDDIAIMYAGKIVETGSIDSVLLNPYHPYTQALIDAVSEPDSNNLLIEKKIRIKHEAETDDPRISMTGCRFYNRCPHAMEVCKTDPHMAEIEKGHSVSCYLYPKKLN